MNLHPYPQYNSRNYSNAYTDVLLWPKRKTNLKISKEVTASLYTGNMATLLLV